MIRLTVLILTLGCTPLTAAAQDKVVDEFIDQVKPECKRQKH